MAYTINPIHAQSPGPTNPNANATTPSVSSFQTDRNLYTTGSKIYFTGIVAKSDSQKLVNIAIHDPSGNFVLITGGFSNSDSTFKIAIDVGSQFTTKGTYSATAFIGKESDGKTVSFDFSPSSGPLTTTPTDLVATPVSSSEINLSWNTPTQNYGKTIVGYKIEGKLASGAYYTLVDNTGNTLTTYSVTGLKSGTTYTFRVSAVYSDDSSTDPSNPASSATSASPVPSGTQIVTITQGSGSSQTADCVTAKNCFNPNPLVVAPGTQVTWKNTDTVSHTVTSGHPSDNATGTIFDSGGLIKPGGTFQFTFQNEGTYDYLCVVHPWMVAQVIVGA